MDTVAATAQRGVPPTQIGAAGDLQQADGTARAVDTQSRAPTGLLLRAINGIRAEVEQTVVSSPGATGGVQRGPTVEAPQQLPTPPENKASEPRVRICTRERIQP